MENTSPSHVGLNRYLLISVVAITVFTAMIYSFYSSNQMINRYTPLVDATMEIKFETTTAHLWFEEIISGDRYENIEDILRHIDQASWYARAMLEGGQNTEGTFIPLIDVILRKETASVIEHIKQFKDITLKRYESIESAGIGSEIDQQYDSLFKNFIDQIDGVKTLLQQKIRKSFSRYQAIQTALIVITIIISGFGLLIQYRFDRQQKKYISDINEERDKAEENERWLKTTMNSMGDGVIITDHNGSVGYLNPVATSLTGWRLNDAKNKKITEIFNIINEQTKKPVDNPVHAVIRKNVVVGLANHTELISKDGTVWPISDSAAPIFDQDNNLTGVVIVFHEVSEQKKVESEKAELESKLQQAYKMEAIGTLAGGIAHDFNNILGAIIGYTEMARDDSPKGSSVANDLDKVLEASYRAADLVKQILAFSRQAETEYILLQPASIVNTAIAMLRPTLPTTIEITQNIDSVSGLIFADPTQIHQILMNLCTNAFHAMEETGGRLDILLKEIDLSREDLTHEPHIKTGTFIQLSVCDTGPGIIPEVKDKIFDPYFTTKGVGKGTGMGLSIVHGLVRNYGGFITLYSEPGEGTALHIFLPVVEKEILPDKEAVKQIPIGKEKILFIDDEDILAVMGKDMLERLGYQVTVRKSSLEALETFQNLPDQFDLVITDQTMPGMTGVDLARRMLQIRPDIPIILCTGYSSIISEEKAKSMGIKEFALKPLTKMDIAVLIRKVLDENYEYS